MAFRDGEEVTRTETAKIEICDVCGSDIGLPSGYGCKPHYEIERDPSWGISDDLEYDIAICSVHCLQKFAAAETDPANRNNPTLRKRS